MGNHESSCGRSARATLVLAAVVGAAACTSDSVDPIEVQQPVGFFVVAVNSQTAFRSVVSAVRLADGGHLALSVAQSSTVGFAGFDVSIFGRDGRASVTTLVPGSATLHPDGGGAVIALIGPDGTHPLPADRSYQRIDTATSFVQPLTLAGSGSGRLTDVVRDGAGLRLADADAGTIWRVDNDGSVLDRQLLSGIGFRALLRDRTPRFVGNIGADLFLVDQVAGTRAPIAVPAGLSVGGSGPELVLPATGDTIWMRGTIDGAPVAAPLGSAIATALPAGTSQVEIDAQGRLIAAAVRPGSHRVTAVRLDDARFDGADGASRIDPTFAGDGEASFETCADTCTEIELTLAGVRIASDGSVALIVTADDGVPGMPRGATYLWWFDAP